MTSPALDPTRDLTIERVIRAPREVVWRAWTDPVRLQQWWVPAPTIAQIDVLEVRPGGGFVTRMSDDSSSPTRSRAVGVRPRRLRCR